MQRRVNLDVVIQHTRGLQCRAEEQESENLSFEYNLADSVTSEIHAVLAALRYSSNRICWN